MARIAGVDLPREKRVEIALTYIYGIGRKTANDILAATGVNPDTRVKDMTEEDEAKIREYIDHHLIVEGDKRRDVALNIVWWRSAATAASATERACLYAASAPRPTRAPVKAPPRPLRIRRSKEGNRIWLNR